MGLLHELFDKHYALISAILGLLLSYTYMKYTKRKDEEKEKQRLEELKEEAIKFREGATGDVKDFGGENQRYTWTQNDEECDVYFDVPFGTRSKHVECNFSPKTLFLKVGDDTLVDRESLLRPVVPDECTWQLETEDNRTRVWITLHKETKTEKNGHWNCVLKGVGVIETSKFGPSVHSVDCNDPDAIRNMVRSYHSARKMKEEEGNLS